MPAVPKLQPATSEEANWFILIGNKEGGPYTTGEMKALADAGCLRRDSFVRRGQSGWGYAQDHSVLLDIIARRSPWSEPRTDEAISSALLARVPEPTAPTQPAPGRGTDVKKQSLFGGVVAAFIQRPLIVPGLIAALMLFGALGSWPYSYFTLLRWVTCGIGVVFAVYAYSVGRVWTSWVFGPLAILFNPLAPVHLSRKTWPLIDVVAAIIFVVGAVLLKGRPGASQSPK